MKKMIILFALFAGSVSAEPINMACVTEYPTTSFVAMTEGENVLIRLIHHNGVKYMPIWSSIITPNDLPLISETASVLAELGDSLEFTMPAKNCKANGMMMNCFGSEKTQKINGHSVVLWAAYTAIQNEKSFAGEYNTIWSSLGLEIDGKTYWVPMRYYDNECFKEFSAEGIKLKSVEKNLFL